MKIKILTILLIIFSLATNAAIIKGRVIDAITHETIPGAMITIVGTNFATVSDSGGMYIFKNIQIGTYTIYAKSIGFKDAIAQQIIIEKADDEITFDIYLKTTAKQIDEIQVLATRNKESEISARDDEKTASNVVNIMSAKSIEALPDLNVADVMQRVSGVSMLKNNSGENSSLIIRGMPSRYNAVMIDGIAMPGSASLNMISAVLMLFLLELVVI